MRLLEDEHKLLIPTKERLIIRENCALPKIQQNFNDPLSTKEDFLARVTLGDRVCIQRPPLTPLLQLCSPISLHLPLWWRLQPRRHQVRYHATVSNVFKLQSPQQHALA